MPEQHVGDRGDVEPAVTASWATDGPDADVDVLGDPTSGVLLFWPRGSGAPEAALRVQTLRGHLDAGREVWVGAEDVLVGGDSTEWSTLLAQLGRHGAETGLMEAPLTRRSSRVFTMRLPASRVGLRATHGDGVPPESPARAPDQ
jgi:hypothetical protein